LSTISLLVAWGGEYECEDDHVAVLTTAYLIASIELEGCSLLYINHSSVSVSEGAVMSAMGR
jgi:hypothetical protein